MRRRYRRCSVSTIPPLTAKLFCEVEFPSPGKLLLQLRRLAEGLTECVQVMHSQSNLRIALLSVTETPLYADPVDIDGHNFIADLQLRDAVVVPANCIHSARLLISCHDLLGK